MVQNKAQLAYSCRTQPSEVDRMPYWEYELYMKSMSKIIEDENKRQEEAEKGRSTSGQDYMRQAQRTMPKMPNYKVPNINMPKI